MRLGWTIAVAVCMLVRDPSHAFAQTGKSSATSGGAVSDSSASTLSGVYTDEQASRGKDVYAGTCRSCHTPASHTGATFNKWWRGKHLSDLFLFVSTRMPKNDPGTLAPEDVADVMAYLLKMNAMPVGKEELPPDADALKKIRIETKRSSAPSTGSTAKRKKP
jgi:mono/diheme cytochrome c family protein